LAAYVGVWDDLPLLVAANRDEFLDRPAADPAVIAYAPWVVAGQDLTAGGTWFGINEAGLVVGLLNRRRLGGPDPQCRSRGLLCLEVLQTRSLAAAEAYVRGTAPDTYNNYNLLVADRYGAFVATNALGHVAATSLSPGVHLLTNLELNDPTCPRIAKSSALFRGVSRRIGDDAERLIAPLRAILSDHTTALDPRAETIDTLCVHLPGYGTRSSSIVAIERGGQAQYWHAPGPPCRTEFAAVSLPPS
jgi:uncharacterized protein with NRDE domain